MNNLHVVEQILVVVFHGVNSFVWRPPAGHDTVMFGREQRGLTRSVGMFCPSRRRLGKLGLYANCERGQSKSGAPVTLMIPL